MAIDGEGAHSAELGHLLDDGAEAPAPATLRAIIARSQRRRERRLKAVTVVAVLIALGGASAAAVVGSQSRTVASPRAQVPPQVSPTGARAGSKAVTGPNWATQPRAVGSAPSGLAWSSGSDAGGAVGTGSSSAGAAAPNRAVVPCLPPSCAISVPPGITGTLNRVFVRTSGDVSVRAYHQSIDAQVPLPYNAAGSSESAQATPPVSASGSSGGSTGTDPAVGQAIISSCAASEDLVVEVANPDAVGSVVVPLPAISVSEPGQPFEVIDSSAVGVEEGTPIEVVTVHVGPQVASMRATFADGSTDQMAVTDGWAVLVDDGTSPLPATATALDASGAVVASATINAEDAIARPTACDNLGVAVPQVGTGSVVPATGSK